MAFWGAGLNFSTPVATRNTPIAKVEYTLGYYKAQGTTPV